MLANLVALVKQRSGASAVQHICAVLQNTCMCCLHACFDSKPSKVVHLSSMSGNAIHGCLQTLVALVQQSSGASYVQHFCAVLQDTCMSCLSACFDSKPSKAVHLSSMSGNAVHGCLQTWWPLSSRAVVLVLCNTLVLYCKTLACAACMHALTANHPANHQKLFT